MHGAWNYTLHPHRAPGQTSDTVLTAVSDGGGPATRRQTMLARLSDPRLTGMTAPEFERLAAVLAPAQAARTQQRYAEQRGGRARRATGSLRGKQLFDDPARLQLTLIYQRQACSMNVLADLLEVTGACIADLVKQTREVLEDHDHHSGTAGIRFRTTRDLLAFLDHDTQPARTETIHALTDPALTGMTREDLHDLTHQLAPRQAAHDERRSHQRRGGPRQPGTRGGIFQQKISNSERVLLTLLYLRKVASLDVLADAVGDISRSSIGGLVRETRPLLEHHDQLPPAATHRYRTAADLLAAAGSTPDTTATDTPTS